MRDIWHEIWRAGVVIADVTGANPNVNYELGLCHALGVPTIIITKSIEDVPFDYRDRRCIVYDTDQALWEKQLVEKLLKKHWLSSTVWLLTMTCPGPMTRPHSLFSS